jgi:hypothetical protein
MKWIEHRLIRDSHVDTEHEMDRAQINKRQPCCIALNIKWIEHRLIRDSHVALH